MQSKLRLQIGRFLRTKRGDLTLAQFARKIGLSDSTLQRLEIGEQNLTIDSLEQIAKRLKCDVREIFAQD